ncbi:MAG: dihydrofolate reductase family protein [Pseudomonadota bacterium]
MGFRCSVFVATSLDGFIARPDGSIDWLEKANESVPSGEDCGYADFMSSVDVIVMGRNTFEKVLTFADWPYEDKPVWVVSQTLKYLPAHLPETVRLMAEAPSGLVASARELGYSRLYIDGGRLIQSFLREGLITDLTITTIPVLIGQGRSLFGESSADIALQLVSSQAYPFGFLQSVYEVQR